MRNGHEARGHKRSRVYRTMAAQTLGRPLTKGEEHTFDLKPFDESPDW